MSRHVDECSGTPIAQSQLREAERDGDAAFLLFGQSVEVHARERAHEGGLAVVDVSGSSDDEGPLCHALASRQPTEDLFEVALSPRQFDHHEPLGLGEAEQVRA